MGEHRAAFAGEVRVVVEREQADADPPTISVLMAPFTVTRLSATIPAMSCADEALRPAGGRRPACRRSPPQPIFATTRSGRWRMANPTGTQGQAGTFASARSASIALTIARTPLSVETVSGAFADLELNSEAM